MKDVEFFIFCIVCITIITAMPFLTQPVYANMDGVDLVFKACESFCQRNSTIRYGEVEIQFIHTTPPKSIEDEAKATKILEDYYKWSSGDDEVLYKERTKDIKKTLHEKTNFYDNIKQSDVKYWFSGDFYSDYKRKTEITSSAKTQKEFSQNPKIVLFSRSENQNFSTVTVDPGMKLSVLDHSLSITENLLQFGQIQGESASVIISSIYKSSSKSIAGESEKALSEIKRIAAKTSAEGSAVIFRIAGEENYDSAYRAMIVESAFKNKMMVRYWIDPSRVFLCPLVQQYDSETGILIKEYRSDNYFLHKQTGLWFPGHFTESTFEKNKGGLIEKKEYLLKSETLKLNTPQGDSVFSADIPEEFTVSDARTVNTKNYFAVKKGTLSFNKGGLDLDRMAWLSPIDYQNREYVPVKSLPFYLRFIFIVTGVLLISVWCFLQIKKWMLNR